MALIHYQRGDIFESKAQVIVNTVNCKGVMGKGLALAFKQKFPAMIPVYQQECKTGKLRIGRPSLYQLSKPWILNFPTKNEWKFPSKIEYLEKGLEYFLDNYKKAGIKSIAFPKLGAQNGKLSWDDVGPLMAKYLSQTDIDVFIYIAEGDKEYQHDLVLENATLEIATEESIWQRFNELAMSEERLFQEVQLSSREAKKVLEKRMVMEFTSLADIESTAKLAKVSYKRIKVYIAHQQCNQIELFDMQGDSSPHLPDKKKYSKTPKQAKKKSDTQKFLL